MENVSLYRDYPRNTGNFCMFSVLLPELNFGRFSGMVPETFRISSHDILGRCDEDLISRNCKSQNRYDLICSAQKLLQKSCQVLERICRLSAYQFHHTFPKFPDSVRMRSVDGSVTESISVVNITF